MAGLRQLERRKPEFVGRREDLQRGEMPIGMIALLDDVLGGGGTCPDPAPDQVQQSQMRDDGSRAAAVPEGIAVALWRANGPARRIRPSRLSGYFGNIIVRRSGGAPLPPHPLREVVFEIFARGSPPAPRALPRRARHRRENRGWENVGGQGFCTHIGNIRL
jgi:hypothetical protein